MKKKLLYFSIVFVIAVVAYYLGTEAAEFISSTKVESRKKEKLKVRELTLNKMQSIQVGGIIPNHLFYDLEGNMVELHRLNW